MNGLSRYSEAEAEARLALAGDVDRAAAWGALAQALLGQGKNHGADAATAKAIAEDPHRASSYYMRAVVLRVLGRLPEAEVAVRKAIELAPAIPFYFAELALILLAVKRTAEALDAVALGLKLDPECLIVCQIYTRALVEAGRLYDGRDNAIRTLSIDPENAASYTQLAQIEFFQNNLADAEKHYRQALRLSPNAQNLRRSLLVILHEQSWLHRTLVAKQDPDTLFQLSIGVFLFWLLIFRGYFRQIVDGDLLPLVGMTACYAASLIMVPIYFRSLYVPLSTLVLSIRPANSALFSRKEILCGQLGSIAPTDSSQSSSSTRARSLSRESMSGSVPARTRKPQSDDGAAKTSSKAARTSEIPAATAARTQAKASMPRPRALVKRGEGGTVGMKAGVFRPNPSRSRPK